MQIANCQVFTLLVMVGLLMFLTAFLTIDFHTSKSQSSVHNGHEFFHAPRKPGLGSDPMTRTVDAVLGRIKSYRENKAASTTDNEKPHEAPVDASGSKTNSKPNVDVQSGSSTSSEPSSDNDKRCKVTFEPKCRINPLVKYWDEVMECYTSPLRDLIGLDAPLEDRKFVVFQADAGGWNNIRMALEVVILFAQVTGRILVLPPNAVLYLLHLNKNWGDNKSSMEDYFDFDKLRAARGLQTLPMNAFLATVARNNLLNIPLPNNDSELIRKPLWDYLHSACYERPWSPGKLYIGFNISSVVDGSATDRKVDQNSLIGDFKQTDPSRMEAFALQKKRELLPYDQDLHSHRAIYFPGSEPNRLLTHFYSMLFFATPLEEHRAKRYMRDRLRYHDQIFCTSSEIIEKLLKLQGLLLTHVQSVTKSNSASKSKDGSSIGGKKEGIQDTEGAENENYSYNSESEGSAGTVEVEPVSGAYKVDPSVAAKILDVVEYPLMHTEQQDASAQSEGEDVRSGRVLPTYVAFHIRRGDFQQEHTRLEAADIVRLTNHLVPDRHTKVAYISTDEGNRTFFEPFMKEYGAVYFLADLKNGTNVDEINQNYVGMIEQVVCANADVFIGTPLSTFTAYITRIRGFMNRTITHIPQLATRSSLRSSDHNLGTNEITSKSTPTHSVRVPAAVTDRSGLYNRTYYFMTHHMYMLHTKPHVHFPLWIRDFVDAFEDIDDDSEA